MKYFFQILCLALCLTAGGGRAAAQCCSPGNPTGGTANQGTMKKGTLRSILFFQHSESHRTFEGSKPAESNLLRRADYNFAGLNLAFGATDRLTFEAESGYFFNRTIRYNENLPLNEERATGLSDVYLHTKFAVWKSLARQSEITLGLGAGLPSRRREISDGFGFDKSRDVQPSTNAASAVAQLFLYRGFVERKLHFFLVNRATLPGKSWSGYEYGRSLISTFFASRVLNPEWSAILQIRHEWRGQDHQNGVLIANSGGRLLFACPQVNYRLRERWNLSLLADLPLWRRYENRQLGKAYNLTLLVGRAWRKHEKLKIGSF